MVVGVCELDLFIPESTSLKQKRFALRSLKDRLRNRLNVAVAESAHHELWQRATLCVVTVSNDSAVVHSVLSRASNFVEKNPRVQLLDVQVELR